MTANSSSPSKWPALLALGLLICLAAPLDLPLARQIRHLDKAEAIPGDLRHVFELAEVFGFGLTVALLVLTAALLDPQGKRRWLRLAAAPYGGGLLANIVKGFTIARLRPHAANLDGTWQQTVVAWMPLLNRPPVWSGPQQSFPSAHTATAFGLAVVLAHFYPRGKWLFFSFALLCGFQRMTSESHFLSDILAGALVGILVGGIVTGSGRIGQWFDRWENR